MVAMFVNEVTGIGALVRRSAMAAGIVLLALFIMQGGERLAPGEALAAGGGPEMALTVRDGGFCVANDCYAAVGETFQLSVDVITAPAEKYIAFQTYIDFGGTFNWGGSEDGAGPWTCSDGRDNVTANNDGKDYQDPDCTTVEIPYIPEALVAAEITWDDAGQGLAVRGPWTHSAAVHGAISGFGPPPESTFTGEVLSLTFSCPAAPAEATLSLLPYGHIFIRTQGAVLSDINQTPHIPKTNSITMHCVAPQAHPGDTDGDGCSDATENGSDPLLGGDRSFVNPWDFYDVAGPGGPNVPDGVVDLANDYMQVSAHFSPSGAPPYDVQYDRGEWTGPNSWDGTQPPDGVIDLPNDILGVIGQIGHSCA